jgi:hypothetical protein
MFHIARWQGPEFVNHSRAAITAKNIVVVLKRLFVIASGRSGGRKWQDETSQWKKEDSGEETGLTVRRGKRNSLSPAVLNVIKPNTSRAYRNKYEPG